MKKTIKVMAAIMLVAAMVFSIASCGGTDMSKLNCLPLAMMIILR